MKTCTCPHEATRNGFLRTGYNALCPFHGQPLVREVPPAPPMAAFVAAKPGTSWCQDCGLFHAIERCDYVDET